MPVSFISAVSIAVLGLSNLGMSLGVKRQDYGYGSSAAASSTAAAASSTVALTGISPQWSVVPQPYRQMIHLPGELDNSAVWEIVHSYWNSWGEHTCKTEAIKVGSQECTLTWTCNVANWAEGKTLGQFMNQNIFEGLKNGTTSQTETKCGAPKKCPRTRPNCFEKRENGCDTYTVYDMTVPSSVSLQLWKDDVEAGSIQYTLSCPSSTRSCDSKLWGAITAGLSIAGLFFMPELLPAEIAEMGFVSATNTAISIAKVEAGGAAVNC